MFSNTKIFKRIENEVFFLSKLYLTEFTLFMALNIYLFLNRTIKFNIYFYHYDLLVFIASIVFGFTLSSFLHNCSHGNTGNKYLNYIVGEFCGAWVMYGYRNFVLIHILHHKYTDDHFDPVNPDGMTFVKFFFAPMRYMIKRANSYLYLKHGSNPNYHLAKNIHETVFHLNLMLRILFWFLVFGPKYFLIFYIPSIISNIFVFAHINYVCHRNNENGEVEIVNLNHNLYFKIANIITIGGYFHKNHHINQNLFNPIRLNTQRSKERFISKEGLSFKKVNIQEEDTRNTKLYNYLAIGNIWGEKNKTTIGDKLIDALSFFKTNP